MKTPAVHASSFISHGVACVAGGAGCVAAPPSDRGFAEKGACSDASGTGVGRSRSSRAQKLSCMPTLTMRADRILVGTRYFGPYAVVIVTSGLALRRL